MIYHIRPFKPEALKKSGNGALIRNGHIACEFNKIDAFFMKNDDKVTATMVNKHNRHSQVAGGLEIICKFITTAESLLIEILKMLY